MPLYIALIETKPQKCERCFKMPLLVSGLDKECQKLLDLVFLPPREEEELSGEACRGAAHSSSDE